MFEIRIPGTELRINLSRISIYRKRACPNLDHCNLHLSLFHNADNHEVTSHIDFYLAQHEHVDVEIINKETQEIIPGTIYRAESNKEYICFSSSLEMCKKE